MVFNLFFIFSLKMHLLSCCGQHITYRQLKASVKWIHCFCCCCCFIALYCLYLDRLQISKRMLFSLVIICRLMGLHNSNVQASDSHKPKYEAMPSWISLILPAFSSPSDVFTCTLLKKSKMWVLSTFLFPSYFELLDWPSACGKQRWCSSLHQASLLQSLTSIDWLIDCFKSS